MDRRSPEVVNQLKHEVMNKTNRFKNVLCYLVHNTVNVMMKTRGYNTIHNELDLSNLTLEQFKHLYNNRKDMEHIYESDKKRMLVMYLQYSTKFGTEEMRDIVSYIYNMNIMNVIVITETPPTSQACDKICIIKPINIEFYCYDDLIHNIIDHNSLYRNYNIVNDEVKDIENIRTISVSDPISRYLGVSIGDVIRMDGVLRRVIK